MDPAAKSAIRASNDVFATYDRGIAKDAVGDKLGCSTSLVADDRRGAFGAALGRLASRQGPAGRADSLREQTDSNSRSHLPLALLGSNRNRRPTSFWNQCPTCSRTSRLPDDSA